MLRRRTPFQMVKRFHQKFKAPIGDRPHMLTPERQALRVELIEEELAEVMKALKLGDLENLAKELADLEYVVNGFAVELGIDFDAVFLEVHRSNMSKLGEDGKPIFRDDGKVLKGPDYFEPDVSSVW